MTRPIASSSRHSFSFTQLEASLARSPPFSRLPPQSRPPLCRLSALYLQVHSTSSFAATFSAFAPTIPRRRPMLKFLKSYRNSSFPYLPFFWPDGATRSLRCGDGAPAMRLIEWWRGAGVVRRERPASVVRNGTTDEDCQWGLECFQG